MEITNPRWSNPEQTQVFALCDGYEMTFGASEGLLAWDTLAASGTPIDPYVPSTVTPRQARLALSEAGLLDQAEAAIAAADEPTQISWKYATEINRSNPLIETIAARLKLTSDQIDVLFRYAATQ